MNCLRNEKEFLKRLKIYAGSNDDVHLIGIEDHKADHRLALETITAKRKWSLKSN